MPTEGTGDMSFEQAAEMSVTELNSAPEAGSQAPAETTLEPAKETAPKADLGDPNNLPPEVLPYYKEMQAAFTKKMQTVSDTLAAFAPHKDRLDLIDRAIAGDPAALKNLQRIAGVPEPAPAPAKDPYGDIPETFETTKDLMQFVDKRAQAIAQTIVEQVLPQVTQPLHDLQTKALEERARAEINAVQAKYPDFDQNIPAIVSIREKYGPIPLEEAYKLATWSPKVPASKLTPQPGASSKAMAPKNASAKTIEEAFAMAQETLSGSK